MREKADGRARPSGKGIKRSLALLALFAAGLYATACGSSSPTSTHTASTASTPPHIGVAVGRELQLAKAPPGGYVKDDGDADNDDENGHERTGTVNDDLDLLAVYGPVASAAERQAIAPLVKHYFAAAAAGDGASGCALIHSSIAAAMSGGESLSSASGKAKCAAALSQLFKDQHQHLAEEQVATMFVTSIHTKGDLGIALLGFHAAPESEILLQREGRVWKMGALMDSELT